MAKTDVTVELFYSGSWHDITAADEVYTRDLIRITRGRPNRSQRVAPSALNLSIKNTSGKYSPRLPTSPLYGLIGRNTPIRVTVGSSVRCVMEVEAWPQRWNVKGSDVWAPIAAYGIMRRLSAPGTTAPAVSALRRAMLVGVLSVGLVAYWSIEEGKDAARAISPIDGVPPLVFTAAVTPGAVADPQAGSLPYAVMNNTDVAFATVALPASSTGFVAFSAAVKGTMPRPTAAKAVIYNATQLAFSGGDISAVTVTTYARWTGTAFDTSFTGVDVVLTGGTPFGSVVGGFNVNMFDGQAHDIQVRLAQSGANVVGQLWVDGVMVHTATSLTKILGTPSTMASPYSGIGTMGGTTVDNTDATFGFGHYSVHTQSAVPGIHDPAIGHVGETAADRIDRLCTEDGIAITIIGDPADSAPVGAQAVAPFLSLLYDAGDADGGILHEPRDSLGLAYRTHTSLYDQTPVVALDYAAGGEVAPPLDPIEDTDAIANDVIVTRLGGISANAVQETGPLNVQEPPAGVGRYRKEFTLILATDDQPTQHAAWLKHIGTWDESRFPVVSMDLTAMDVEGLTALIADAAALDIGDRFTITNPPAWLPPDDIEQHAQGFAEVIESHRWSIATNATPAGPYSVGSLDSSTSGRLDNGACTLNEALDTTETGVDVVSLVVAWGSQFPYDVGIGGERMTVTARSGAGLTQTLTVTRSVNGVVKTHTAGATVRLWQPLRVAR